MKKKKSLILLGLVVLTGCLLFLGGTFAKYVSNSIWNYYLQSKEFYFSSDKLSEEVKVNSDKQWDGGSVSFTVRNSLNDALVTNYDISYKAVCTLKGVDSSKAKCVINDTDSDTFNGVLSNYNVCVNNKGDGVSVEGFGKSECEVKGYDWIRDVTNKDLRFKIVGDELDEAEVLVVVTSLSPYKKVLKGEFKLVRDKNGLASIVKKYKSYLDYDELVLGNSFNEDKCVSVKWDSSKIRLDYDQSLVMDFSKDSNDYINTIKVKLGSMDSVAYRFFKATTDTISEEDFTIEDDVC